MSAYRQVTLFLVAAQFLTRIPLPSVSGFQPQWLNQSLRYFPLVGAFVGLANAAVWWLSSRVLPQSVAVGLMLCASLLLTGAFHEDGFADVCDGFGGGTTRERVLAIMKDSRVGAFGAIGVFMLLGVKWAAWVAMPADAFALVIVSAHVISRWSAIGLLWGLRYARDGEGKSTPFREGLSAGEWALSGLIGAVAVLAIAAVLAPVSNNRLPFAEIAGFCAAGLAAVTAASYFKSRIGGYTGDCLGAAQQLAELAFALGALVVLRTAAHSG